MKVLDCLGFSWLRRTNLFQTYRTKADQAETEAALNAVAHFGKESQFPVRTSNQINCGRFRWQKKCRTHVAFWDRNGCRPPETSGLSATNHLWLVLRKFYVPQLVRKRQLWLFVCVGCSWMRQVGSNIIRHQTLGIPGRPSRLGPVLFLQEGGRKQKYSVIDITDNHGVID